MINILEILKPIDWNDMESHKHKAVTLVDKRNGTKITEILQSFEEVDGVRLVHVKDMCCSYMEIETYDCKYFDVFEEIK